MQGELSVAAGDSVGAEVAALALRQNVTAGALASCSPAISASTAITSTYFSGSPTGRIFALAATRMPATSTPDPTATALAPLVGAALAQVQAGTLTPARAWSRLLRHTTRG